MTDWCEITDVSVKKNRITKSNQHEDVTKLCSIRKHLTVPHKINNFKAKILEKKPLHKYTQNLRYTFTYYFNISLAGFPA